MEKQTKKVMLIVLLSLIGLGIIVSLFVVIPHYRVWMQGKRGEAALAEAEYDRRVAIREAEAEHEAAVFLRKAEVERAMGVAEAMEIIQKQLDDNYLMYRSIMAQKKMADSPNHTTVYIPSGNMGIPLIRNVE